MSDMKYLEKECFLCQNTICLIANYDEDENEIDDYDLTNMMILCLECAEKQKENIQLMEVS